MTAGRSVPFPLAGQGFRLRFSLSAWAGCYRALKADSFTAAVKRIASLDPDIVPAVFTRALRDETDAEVKEFDFEGSGIPLEEAA
ncbi:MAG: hypothetical protein KDK08_28345, partial [Rhizobiaceae bacterium]|nr:hypothetical protein [Rhizobiaceae bacterium]